MGTSLPRFVFLRGRGDAAELLEEEEGVEEEGEGGVSLGKNRWLVERLLGRRVSLGSKAGDMFRAGTTLYKVQWQKCSVDDATWEPKSHIAPQLTAEFDAANPVQPELPPPPPPGSPASKRSHGPACSPSAKSPGAKRASGHYHQSGDSGFVAELD